MSLGNSLPKTRGGMKNVALRNKEYLVSIFDHRRDVIEEVYEKNDHDYGSSFDKLVSENSHGTPGRGCAPLELSRSSSHTKPDKNNRRNPVASQTFPARLSGWSRLRRAEALIELWKRETQFSDNFWDGLWGKTYRDFKMFQKEVGVLRDDILQMKLDTSLCKYSKEHISKTMNDILYSSVRQWYRRWGELDLHRLTIKDALNLIQSHLKQPLWLEQRIVAGQTQHNGRDHNSEGFLYDLLHFIFENGYRENMWKPSERDQMKIADIKRYLKSSNIKVKFYSKGAAVVLSKNRVPKEK